MHSISTSTGAPREAREQTERVGSTPTLLAMTPPRTNAPDTTHDDTTAVLGGALLQVDFTPRNSVDASYVRMSASDFAPGTGETLPLAFTPLRTPPPPKQAQHGT